MLDRTGGFALGKRTRGSIRVAPPDAFVGRSPSADVVVTGDGDYVSNEHLLLECTSGFWVVRDLNSTHGTVAFSDAWGRLELWPYQALPVIDGMRLELAKVVAIRIDVVWSSPPAGRKPTKGRDGMSPGPAWIVDPRQRVLADELVKRRRRDPNDLTVPSALDLAHALGMSVRSVYNVRDELAAHRAVARHLRAGERITFPALAAAVARAFPHLLQELPASR